MRNVLKPLLIAASIPFILSSCEKYEKKCYCLDTSTTIEYYAGECYQASYKDVLETVYVISAPLNPDADPSEYTYDLVFNENIQNDYISLTDGLNGKEIDSVFKIADNILKVNIKRYCQSENAKYGFIKINKRAFEAKTSRVQEANIFAYVAIGEQGSILANKPNISEDGIITE